MGLTRTRGRREYADEALAERGRFRTESKANKPIPLKITNLKRESLYFLFFHFKSISTSPLFRTDLPSVLVTAVEI